MKVRALAMVCFGLTVASCGPPTTLAESPPRASADEPRLSVEEEVARLNAPTPWTKACGRHVIEALDRARNLPGVGTSYDRLTPTWRDVTDGSEEVNLLHRFKIVTLSVNITRRASPLDATFEERAWSSEDTGAAERGSFPRSWSRETRWGKASMFFYFSSAAAELVPLLRPAIDACLAQ